MERYRIRVEGATERTTTGHVIAAAVNDLVMVDLADLNVEYWDLIDLDWSQNQAQRIADTLTEYGLNVETEVLK